MALNVAIGSVAVQDDEPTTAKLDQTAIVASIDFGRRFARMVEPGATP